MPILMLEVEGPEIIVDLLKRSLEVGEKVTIIPESIFPGYVLDVVAAYENDD